MKIDRHNPRHWAYLVASGLNMLAVAALRPVVSRAKPTSIVLYGHVYNGNLSAFVDYCRENHPGEFDFFFASLDDADLADLPADVRPLNFRKPGSIRVLARAGAIITDRAATTLELLTKWTSIPFVDVWHGMPYKGFTDQNFLWLRNYDEVWVTSPGTAEIYAKQFGVPVGIIQPTGYARVDPLVNGSYDGAALKAKYGIEESFEKVVLLAPTWKQDDANRSIIPYGVSSDEFFETLNEIGRETNTLFIFRAHLHVAEADDFASYPFVRNMSNKRYPFVEEFLSFSDILVTDWSSLAFDYLALKRPTIFLDVTPPFKDGFSVGPEHRFGEIATTFPDFAAALRRYIADPASFTAKYADEMAATEELLYGQNLDGKAADRQYDRLRALVGKRD